MAQSPIISVALTRRNIQLRVAGIHDENRNDFETHLPGILGGMTEDDYIKQQWLIYFKKQIEAVFDDYKNLPRLILIAAIYPNPDERGKTAEAHIEMICNSLISSIQSIQS